MAVYADGDMLGAWDDYLEPVWSKGDVVVMPEGHEPISGSLFGRVPAGEFLVLRVSHHWDMVREAWRPGLTLVPYRD